MRSATAISKLVEFNDKFAATKAGCAVYVDWLYDTFAYTTENFVIAFYKRENINSNATIDYKKVGEYQYRLCKDDVKLQDIDGYRVIAPNPRDSLRVYVERWLPNDFMYHLNHCKPTSRGFQGCADIYDMTLKEGDALCYWTEDKKNSLTNFQELDNQTTTILERKYKKLEEVAVSRKYKPGWIYHRMCEQLPEVDSLWAAYGYYFPLEGKASAFSYTYKWKYFRKEAEAEYQDRLELSW